MPIARLRSSEPVSNGSSSLTIWSSAPTAIATPGEVYEAIRDYFETRALELDAELFRSQMDEELHLLAGEIEQDLRQRYPGEAARFLDKEPLEARFRESVAGAWVDFGAQSGKTGRESRHQ